MKKLKKTKALLLSTQTIRMLEPSALVAVAGGDGGAGQDLIYDRKQGATKTCDP
jgi:hypothetical protein